jgi:hypothetical protein
VACIDAPRLHSFDITFFNDIVFDMPQLVQFIGRTPTLNPFKKAGVSFRNGTASVDLTSQKTYFTPPRGLRVTISCSELHWQVSSVEQVCTSCLPSLSILKDLDIAEERFWKPVWKEDIENTQWLELLYPFTAVKNLFLSEEFARRIVPALQELDGGRMTEVLPALESIFLEGLEPSGPVRKVIEQFVATRQATGHPISVSPWYRRRRRR